MNLPYRTQTFNIGGREVQLLVPDPSAAQEQFRSGNQTLPYWSQVWPAALGLVDFLAQNTELIKGKKVIELAAGLGLPSIFAASYAAHVVSSDYLEEPTWFIRESAKRTGLVNLEARILNWHHLPPDLEAEVVLLSDVNYEPSQFLVLHAVLQQLLQRGVCVLLSTPQRLSGREFITPLLYCCRHQEIIFVPHGGGDVAVNVFVLAGE